MGTIELRTSGTQHSRGPLDCSRLLCGILVRGVCPVGFAFVDGGLVLSNTFSGKMVLIGSSCAK